MVKEMPRIYVTSRKRTPSSASPSDFHFSLQTPIELPEGAKGYIDSFTCSNTWETIIKDVNARVYYQWSDQGATMNHFDLAPGDISSTTVLATKLTTMLAAHASQSAPVTVTAVGDTRINFSAPTLAAGDSFVIFARTTLNYGNLPMPTGGWIDACGIIGAMTKDLLCLDSVAAGLAQVPQDATSQFINLAPYQTLYLHSHIGQPDSYGPSGETTVIASVVCGDSVPGDLITHHVNGLVASPIELPSLLSDMHFSLRDYNGKLIDTDGHDIAFTLVIDTNI